MPRRVLSRRLPPTPALPRKGGGSQNQALPPCGGGLGGGGAPPVASGLGVLLDALSSRRNPGRPGPVSRERSRSVGSLPGPATRSTRRRTRMQPAADAPIARRRPAPPELLQGLGDRFGSGAAPASPSGTGTAGTSPPTTPRPRTAWSSRRPARRWPRSSGCAPGIGSPSSPTAPGPRSKGTSWPSRAASPSTCPG